MKSSGYDFFADGYEEVWKPGRSRENEPDASPSFYLKVCVCPKFPITTWEVEMSDDHHAAICLLRLRLHMVRDHEPVTVDFLVDISHEVIELGRPAILHFLFAGFLTHLPREVAIDVNMLV